MGQAADSAAASAKKIRNYKPGMKYRLVGSTGIYISAFSIGTTRGELEAISAGVDSGVNFIHTSANYIGGRAIDMVAKAIKGRTDKVYIALKGDFATLEETLKALGIPCADFVFFPQHDPDALRKNLSDIRTRFMTWRDKGLVKFAGLTSHKAMAECIDIALGADFFSCVMPAYGPAQVKELADRRSALAKKGMSIIAMKTKGELSDADYPAQITAALASGTVASVLRGVKTLEELKAWTAAANSAQTGWLRTRNGTQLAQDYHGCTMCGRCERACPKGIPTADVVRCVRYYHQAEHDPALAAGQFAEMGLALALTNCDNCGLCEASCPQKIGVRAELRRSREFGTAGLWS
jgi:hypothetical protein